MKQQIFKQQLFPLVPKECIKCTFIFDYDHKIMEKMKTTTLNDNTIKELIDKDNQIVSKNKAKVN